MVGNTKPSRKPNVIHYYSGRPINCIIGLWLHRKPGIFKLNNCLAYWVELCRTRRKKKRKKKCPCSLFSLVRTMEIFREPSPTGSPPSCALGNRTRAFNCTLSLWVGTTLCTQYSVATTLAVIVGYTCIINRLIGLLQWVLENALSTIRE